MTSNVDEIDMLEEFEIRRPLVARLNAGLGESPGRVIEELGVAAGRSRVDVAVVNGSLDGFEIKSDVDSLSRIKQQAGYYGAVFDRLTLVADRHLDAARRKLPEWWGLLRPHRQANGVEFEEVRRAEPNPVRDKRILCQMLWRDEAIAYAAEFGFRRKGNRGSRHEFWREIAKRGDLEEIAAHVRERLLARGDWRRSEPTTKRAEPVSLFR